MLSTDHSDTKERPFPWAVCFCSNIHQAGKLDETVNS